MKCKYAVTFEFEESKPITCKGEIEALHARTITARAVDDAIGKNPNLKWSSLVVLIERI